MIQGNATSKKQLEDAKTTNTPQSGSATHLTLSSASAKTHKRSGSGVSTPASSNLSRAPSSENIARPLLVGSVNFLLVFLLVIMTCY